MIAAQGSERALSRQALVYDLSSADAMLTTTSFKLMFCKSIKGSALISGRCRWYQVKG
jgi:hypothetical protein